MSQDELEEVISLEHALSEVFGTHVPLRARTEWVVSRREIHLPVYERVLRHLSPDVVALVASYGKEDLIEACQSLGIPAVELQHGVVSNAHLGYHYPTPRRKIHFPDYFLSFGPAWNDLPDWPISKERIVDVGFPYFELAQARDAADAKRRPGQVLFISQGTIGKRMSRFAVRCVEAHPALDVVYKLHPGEKSRWQSQYPWLAASSVRVVEGDDPPLYRLMAEANVVVGAGSTALYEAAGLGAQVAIIPSFASRQEIETFRALLGADALLVETSEELEAAALSGGRSSANEGGRLFREGAAQNIISFLERFVEGTEDPGL